MKLFRHMTMFGNIGCVMPVMSKLCNIEYTCRCELTQHFNVLLIHDVDGANLPEIRTCEASFAGHFSQSVPPHGSSCAQC